MGFIQTAPVLANTYLDDRVLRSWLRRVLPPQVLADQEGRLGEFGELAANEWYPQQLAQRHLEPRHVPFDAFGQRIDHVELSPFWRDAPAIAAKWGLIALGQDDWLAQHGRPLQFAFNYLFHPSSELFSCPLAMTDGALKVLQDSDNKALIDRAVPRLLSRDPKQLWISGQWMTETSGGSDVGGSETVARQDERGRWRLSGRKWFASAITSDIALLLARPEKNPAGADGLALFYIEPRKSDGRLRNITIDRLKDKLGTRKLPTAEIHLDNTPAELVGDSRHGVRAIAPMLNVTRLWNAVCAVSAMRRGLTLARDYATRRVVFAQPLIDQPLHQETLADLQAEFEGMFHLTFHAVELMGRIENGQHDDASVHLLRLITPIVKLTTAKAATQALGEVIESFGGAGYCEDTGLPGLLRDTQVLPIWEGTTNVLALDVIKALKQIGGLQHWLTAIRTLTSPITLPELEGVVKQVRESATAVAEWIQKRSRSRDELPAGARGLAMTMGRTLALALLAQHAEWSFRTEHDPRTLHAARRFARLGCNRLTDTVAIEARTLSSDIYA
ncbi:MAG TPA: acyl-CoA dehydrogenase family protein [Pseudomonadota bacterium]|jgi:acyl-CoA dehydrogenase|nr:acyl-CoA dehydrogenase family protein [Pseudomonadota bacterium]